MKSKHSGSGDSEWKGERKYCLSKEYHKRFSIRKNNSRPSVWSTFYGEDREFRYFYCGGTRDILKWVGVWKWRKGCRRKLFSHVITEEFQ